MNIQRTSIRSKNTKEPKRTKKSAKKSENATTQDSVTIKNVINKGAFLTGGATVGLGMGVVSGQLLTSLTGSDVMTTIGGAAGALGGAASALSVSESKQAASIITKSVFSWAGATAGAGVGMKAFGHLGSTLVTRGAASIFGTHGELIGAGAGALTGMALPHLFSRSKTSKLLTTGAFGVAGATAGAYAGAALQPLIAPFGPVQAMAPILLGITGGIAMADARYNFDTAYLGFASPALKAAQRSTVGGSLGSLGGAALGGIAVGLGASPIYSIAAPLLGGTVGVIAGLRSRLPKQVFETAVKVSSRALIGDIAGNVLTAATGNGLYRDLGGIVGGASGTIGLLSEELKDVKGAKEVLKTGVGATVGAVIGDLAGHGLTAITGNALYRNIGGIAGGLSGAGRALESMKVIPTETGSAAAKGLTTGLAGGAAGALVGSGLTYLTGQSIWQSVMPVLGATTGALGGMAISLNS